MFVTYIIYSNQFRRYYIGSTGNLVKRLKKHNTGKVKSTKGYTPWVLVYSENFPARLEAVKRERQIKLYKGGEAFKRLVK